MNIKDEKKTSDVALLFSSNDSQKKKFDRKKKGNTDDPEPLNPIRGNSGVTKMDLKENISRQRQQIRDFFSVCAELSLSV